MSLYLSLLSIFLSFFSTCIMSYLALGIEITFWVAPIISLAVVIVFLHLLRAKNIQDNAVIILSAGSIGGIVGLSFGFSWPTLYYLHKNIFLSWAQFPALFAIMIGLLIIAAGCLALLLTYSLQQYFKLYNEATFPTVTFVASMIYSSENSGFAGMVIGLAMSFIWSGIALFFRTSLHGFWLLQVHTIPTLISMGFVAGHLIAKPLCIGMGLRFVSLFGLKRYFWKGAQDVDFMLTFTLGMLFALICLSIVVLLKRALRLMQVSKYHTAFLSCFLFGHMRTIVFTMITVCLCYLVFQSWHIDFLQTLYILVSASIATVIVAYIFGEVGVLDLPNFGSFIVVPFLYLFSVSSESALIAFVFCTVSMGLVVTLLFSWKLSVSSGVSYSRLLRYQILGFVVAVISIGFLIWWYITFFKLGYRPLFSEQAMLQERFMTLVVHDYSIWLLGFFTGAVLYFVVADLSIVIAGCMMSFSVIGWLVVAGILANFIQKRERFYPVCFGVYASHAIWLFIQALLL